MSIASAANAAKRKGNGFIGHLSHRDSLLSPLHNPSSSLSELSRDEVQHSVNRANYFASRYVGGKFYVGEVNRFHSHYSMKVYIGSRKQEMKVIPDTGSDLLWVKCSNLSHDHSQLIFDSSSSKTYDEVKISSHFCQALDIKSGGGINGDTCNYRYNYVDNIFTSGVLSTESFYLPNIDGDFHEFKHVPFGCASYYDPAFDVNNVQGVIGLGKGRLSFSFEKRIDIGHKFSYCLDLQRDVPGVIIFGGDSNYNSKTIKTNIVAGHHESLYYLRLKRIRIKDEKPSTTQGNEYIFIDSGTMHTFLRASLYDELEVIVRKMIPIEPEIVEDMGLCYPYQLSYGLIRNFEIVFEFDGGNLSLPHTNAFVMVYGRYNCLTILRHEELSLFGNRAQLNFKVEYDLYEQHIAFTPMNCKDFP